MGSRSQVLVDDSLMIWSLSIGLNVLIFDRQLWDRETDKFCRGVSSRVFRIRVIFDSKNSENLLQGQ